MLAVGSPRWTESYKFCHSNNSDCRHRRNCDSPVPAYGAAVLVDAVPCCAPSEPMVGLGAVDDVYRLRTVARFQCAHRHYFMLVMRSKRS